MTRYTNSAPLPDKTNSQLRDISQSIPPEQSTILSKNKLITGKKKGVLETLSKLYNGTSS